eukprot:6309076-Karenia_brevis.AAC.1
MRVRRRQKELGLSKKVSALQMIVLSKRTSLGQRSQRIKERRAARSKHRQKVKGGGPRRRKLGRMIFGLRLMRQ